jgi:methylmalonyl-CoA/ethylmalonyl-CoA epimerase
MTEKVKTNFVDHICIAVKDVKQAEKDYVAAFGWEVAYRYVDEPEKIRVTGFMVGVTAIEVMEDLDGTGEVAKFIARAGEGVMLISYNVDNCAEALEKLKKNNVRLIDQRPRYFAEYDRNFAFIHPKATHGILTEIIDGEYKLEV